MFPLIVAIPLVNVTPDESQGFPPTESVQSPVLKEYLFERICAVASENVTDEMSNERMVVQRDVLNDYNVATNNLVSLSPTLNTIIVFLVVKRPPAVFNLSYSLSLFYYKLFI